MKKKELIQKHALKLFNIHGVQNISTNHICKEMNISPGNLYYHYPNKEKIIQDIYEEMIQLMNSVWNHMPETLQSLLTKMFSKLQKLHFNYRFFYRDIIYILQKDEVLKKRYEENRDLRLKEMKTVFSNLENADYFILPKDRKELNYLFEQIWFLSEFWEVHQVLFKKSKDKNRQLIIMTNTMKAYLTLKGKKELEKLINKLQKGDLYEEDNDFDLDDDQSDIYPWNE